MFPLAAGSKRPALHGVDRCPGSGTCAGGHVGWEQRATTDPDRVARCWADGEFNVGIATGPSRLAVLDLDTPKPGQVAPPDWRIPGVVTGEDTLAVLCDRVGEALLYATYTVVTPSGGRHLYFTAPDATLPATGAGRGRCGAEVTPCGEPARLYPCGWCCPRHQPGGSAPTLRNTAGTLGWLIDTRAHGGYVVAAGSATTAGPYVTVHDTDPDPAPLPGWLVDALTPAPMPPQQPVTVELGTGRRAAYLRAAIGRNLDAVRDAPPGQRNRALYGAAVALGQLVAGGALTEDDVTPALLSAALAVGQRETEAVRTIRSGYRAGSNRPRSVAA